jgi:RHS repeat-associated protein
LAALTKCSGATSGTLYWRGIGSDTLDESDLAGNATEEYIYFNGQKIARRDVPSNGIHYYFSDHLGSHGVVENATGTVCEQDIDYCPFGGAEHDYCPNVAQNYKFTGKERDNESGLDYFEARHYNSAIARFLQTDPSSAGADASNPQSLNRYSYVNNKSLTMVDENGLWPTWYHNQIIEWNFKQYGSRAVAILEATSKAADSPSGQLPSLAYIHGMSNGLLFQSTGEATQLSLGFINENLTNAVMMQIAFEKQGGSGYGDATWIFFGLALHTATDMQSPEHKGAQPWVPDPAGALIHGIREGLSARSSAADDTEARYLANVAAARLWQMFLIQLSEERKKTQPKPEEPSPDTPPVSPTEGNSDWRR